MATRDPNVTAPSGDWSIAEGALPSARGVLSPAEIEALLRPNLDDMPAIPTAPERVEERPTAEFTPENPVMAAAREITSALSLSLRQDCGLDAVATPLAASETSFAAAFEAPSASGVAVCFGRPGQPIAAMWILPEHAAIRLVISACGGDAFPAAAARPISDAETDILAALLAPLSPAFGAGSSLVRVERRPDYAAAFAPSGRALAVDTRIDAVGVTGGGRLIVADRGDAATAPVAGQSHAPGVTAVLTARLARISVPMSRISRLKAGDTLLLGLPPDQPVTLLSGGRDGAPAAEAEIGRNGARMAVRIKRRRG